MHRRTMLGIAAVMGTAVAGRTIVALAQAKPREIAIMARKFTYEPAEVTLKLDEPVVFMLTSADVVMGFSVPDFGVRGTIIPGQTTRVPMTPGKTGEFTFLCDVFCGSGHETMEGRMRVVA